MQHYKRSFGDSICCQKYCRLYTIHRQLKLCTVLCVAAGQCFAFDSSRNYCVHYRIYCEEAFDSSFRKKTLKRITFSAFFYQMKFSASSVHRKNCLDSREMPVYVQVTLRCCSRSFFAEHPGFWQGNCGLKDREYGAQRRQRRSRCLLLLL